MIHSDRRPLGGAAYPPCCKQLARSWAGWMPLTRSRPPGHRRNTCATAAPVRVRPAETLSSNRAERDPRPGETPAEDLRTPSLRAGHPAPPHPIPGRSQQQPRPPRGPGPLHRPPRPPAPAERACLHAGRHPGRASSGGRSLAQRDDRWSRPSRGIRRYGRRPGRQHGYPCRAITEILSCRRWVRTQDHWPGS
jgi:hypothetical protein